MSLDFRSSQKTTHFTLTAEAIVTCNETTIKVEVEKTSIIRRHENNLHLNKVGDSSCNLTRLSNATHLVAVMALNACGTLVEVRLIVSYCAKALASVS